MEETEETEVITLTVQEFRENTEKMSLLEKRIEEHKKREKICYITGFLIGMFGAWAGFFIAHLI